MTQMEAQHLRVVAVCHEDAVSLPLVRGQNMYMRFEVCIAQKTCTIFHALTTLNIEFMIFGM
jgi:hypothetical protein